MIRLPIRALGPALLLLALLPHAALAHERRDVGKYQFVVGFAQEPALQGQPNGAWLRVVNRETNQPVEGAENTLKVSIAHGGGPARQFDLQAVRGQPGVYTAEFIPTRTGSYVFTFAGSLDGTAIDQRFESGPGRFNDVESPQSMQFPEPVPYVGDLARQVEAAEARATQAQLFALAASALGLLGLAVALVALLRRPSARSSVG